MPPLRFDLVLRWDVLEHLNTPQQALRNLFRTIRHGGVIVLALPNLCSIKGLVAKLTPFVVHRWFYRSLIGDRLPLDDTDQFPTHLRLAAAPGRILRLAQEAGLDKRYLRLYEGPVQWYLRMRSRWADLAFAAVGKFAGVVTLKQFDPNLTDCIIVLQKPLIAPGTES